MRVPTPEPKRCAFLILLCGFLSLAGCKGKVELRRDYPQLAAGVVMRDVTFRSSALGREMPYRVFLPEKIATGEKLPVAYLLHGKGGDFRNWSNYSDVARYAANGMILVMPEGNSSYYLNAAETPADRYENYLIHDLPADVASRFPARTDRAGRAIAGVSMGGFGAVTLALRHPDLFVFAGAISPPVDAPERRFSWKRWGQWTEFRSIFGPWGSAERQARDPFLLVNAAQPDVTPYLYLTAGDHEALLEPIQRFAARLKARGLHYEFHTKPGGHDWSEWDAQIPECLERMQTALLIHDRK